MIMMDCRRWLASARNWAPPTLRRRDAAVDDMRDGLGGGIMVDEDAVPALMLSWRRFSRPEGGGMDLPGVAAPVRLWVAVLRAGVVPLSMRGSIDCRVRGTLRTGLAAESGGLEAPMFVLSLIPTGPSVPMLWRRPAAAGAEVPGPPRLPGGGGTLSGTPPIVWRRSPGRGGGPRLRVDISNSSVDCRAVLTYNSQSAVTCRLRHGGEGESLPSAHQFVVRFNLFRYPF